MIYSVLTLLALFGSAAMAWKWGGLDERLASGGFIIAGLASNLANTSHYGHTEIGVLVVDVALLVGLMFIALYSDRFWPMWAAAFQVVAVTVHVASLAESGEFFAPAYAVGLIFWTYPVLIALMVGTWMEARYRTR